MADESRTHSAPLEELLLLARDAAESDFFQLLRRLEVLYRERPRHGSAARPADEPVRFGQRPRGAFAPSAVEQLQLARDAEQPHRLWVAFCGMFGPNGPLPQPVSEYAERHSSAAHRFGHEDPFVDLVDLFHHRTLALLYRAWAASRPVVQRDRPEDDRFAHYMSALTGEPLPPREPLVTQQRSTLQFAGVWARQIRSAEGLEAAASELLRTPVQLEPLIGEWLEIPAEYSWKLGEPAPRNCPALGVLGESTVIGPQVFERQHKFRLVVGPVDRSDLQQLLPGGARLAQLKEWVRSYAGDTLRWDLRLVLAPGALEPCYLGVNSCLGDTSYLIVDASELIPQHLVDPFSS